MSHFRHFSGEINKQTKNSPSHLSPLCLCHQRWPCSCRYTPHPHLQADSKMCESADVNLKISGEKETLCLPQGVWSPVCTFLIPTEKRNISVSLAREELPRHTNKPVVWLSNLGITSSKLKFTPSTHKIVICDAIISLGGTLGEMSGCIYTQCWIQNSAVISCHIRLRVRLESPRLKGNWPQTSGLLCTQMSPLLTPTLHRESRVTLVSMNQWEQNDRSHYTT